MTSTPIRPSVSIVYPRTRSRGGAQGVLAWCVHALQHSTDLSVYTLDECDPDIWNRIYGTRIVPEAVQWVSFQENHPRLAGFLARLDMTTLDQYALMKWFNRSSSPESVPFSCHNEMAFKRPGLQYIHFPMLMTGARELSRAVGQSGSWPKEMLGRVCKILTATRSSDLCRNLNLCNSRFIENLFLEYYGKDALTQCLHPPVPLPEDMKNPPWENRTNSVVMIGRLVPHKRFEEGIELVRRCREAGVDLGVHIVTTGGVSSYQRQLEELSDDKPWIQWHWNLSRPELQDLCTHSRFGLHCNRNEHFGMVTAELSGLGCLVLGHNSGGTREILPHPYQRFETPQEGAEKLIGLLETPKTRREVLKQSEKRVLEFNSKHFCETLRGFISEFVQSKA